MADTAADRFARLGAGIEAARRELAARQDLDWPDAGDVIDALSHDLNQATQLYDDDETLHGHAADLEERLGAVQARLAG